jgi:hypothetical protein
VTSPEVVQALAAVAAPINSPAAIDNDALVRLVMIMTLSSASDTDHWASEPH